MACVNVYLSDELKEACRAKGVNISQVCQDALKAALQMPLMPATKRDREGYTYPLRKTTRPYMQLTAEDVAFIKQARSDYEYELNSLEQRMKGKNGAA